MQKEHKLPLWLDIVLLAPGSTVCRAAELYPEAVPVSSKGPERRASALGTAVRKVDRHCLVTAFDHTGQHEEKDHLGQEVERDDQVDDRGHGSAALPHVRKRQAKEQERAEICEEGQRIDRVLPELAIGQDPIETAQRRLDV